MTPLRAICMPQLGTVLCCTSRQALLPHCCRRACLGTTDPSRPCSPAAPPQFAYKAGSGAAPRAWSKYTEGTSAHKRLAAPEKTGANAQPLGAGADGAAGQQAGKKGKKGKDPLPEEGECGFQ